ncbi:MULTISPECIES: serine/threonine-protein kinase [Streptomyces]|uniref:non-specific serine/threonine protein kinase n=1 Tax=Streptomyces chartreusis NRRL 3882 TaxID=1079985 RepID=A0A2N9B8J1_STRCX|nr:MULTISPECIES: serine/threonine-protein kinase [Streptomyces]MYS89399.1 protein kinase [Streptomyces sp. SID5464]SOR79648.1 Serine/threonine-protein kinase PrkC [Streptomyces chartreusis NRRL 3882]
MSNDGGGTGAQGRSIGGRYRLIERIGSGGSGTVWRAYDELVQREVAVKQPRLPGDPGDPEDESRRRAAHRLYREARAAARVDHPAAVTIHDVVVEPERQPEARAGRTVRHGRVGRDGLDAVDAALDGLPWIVMELVPGGSLHEVLRRGPVEAREAARIGLAVLGALRAGHSVGIVHRDVKPANVLLGPHRRVVLTDFGIAHVQGEESLTTGGESIGSLEFVAPERMTGRIAGPASDLWSLGVLLYAAVEGASPFRRDTPEATLTAILAAEPPEPKQAGPLGPLIARLLVKEPEQRPGAEEVAKALEAAAGQRPASDETPKEPQQAAHTRESANVRDSARMSDSVDIRDSASMQESADDTVPPKRQGLLRPGPLALMSALLAGGIGAATHLGDTSSAETTEEAARKSPAPTAPGPSPDGAWTPHRDQDMAAVLRLPSHYRELDKAGSTTDQPRTALYGSERGGSIQVRLLVWDKAPGSPMAQARKARVVRGGAEEDAHTQYTRTSVQGFEAALADTTYNLDEDPRRVMRVVIRTDDDRMYELRVDMPKGTPEETEGTSVFKGARDRLRIVKG